MSPNHGDKTVPVEISLKMISSRAGDSCIMGPQSHPNTMNTPPGIPVVKEKNGMSCLAIGGIGCLVIVVILFLGGGAVVFRFMPQLKEFASESKKDPAKAAAMLMLKMNPDIQIMATDDAKREVTFKVKSSGDTVTMNFDDIQKGKMKMTNSKGEEVSIDASDAGKGGIVMKGPQGQTVIGGGAAATAPPSWVVAYPGLTPEEGGMKSEQDGNVTGMVRGSTKDPVTKVKTQLEASLKAAGYTTETNLITAGDGSVTGSITANKADGKTTATYLITTEDGKTVIMTQYEGPKS